MQDFEASMPILWPKSFNETVTTSLFPPAIGGEWIQSGMSNISSASNGLLAQQEKKVRSSGAVYVFRVSGTYVILQPVIL